MRLMAAMPAKKMNRDARLSGETWPAREKVADGQIEEGPESVDDRGGETFAGRLGERRWEAAAGDAVDKVRDNVGEKRSGEEAGEIGVPGPGPKRIGDGVRRAEAASARSHISKSRDVERLGGRLIFSRACTCVHGSALV